METRSNSKKQWFIGCAIALIILVISALITVYIVIHKTRSMIGSIRMNPPAMIALLEKDEFVPPESGVIREDELRQYIQINREIRNIIEEKLSDNKHPFDWENEQNYLNLVAKLYEIREIQTMVLKKQAFSVRKYKWITRQLVIIFGGDIVKQMNLLLRTIESEQPEIDSSREIRNIPQQNLDLFNRYEREIQEVVMLWVLGV